MSPPSFQTFQKGRNSYGFCIVYPVCPPSQPTLLPPIPRVWCPAGLFTSELTSPGEATELFDGYCLLPRCCRQRRLVRLLCVRHGERKLGSLCCGETQGPVSVQDGDGQYVHLQEVVIRGEGQGESDGECMSRPGFRSLFFPFFAFGILL